jgi:hypothetical protein
VGSRARLNVGAHVHYSNDRSWWHSALVECEPVRLFRFVSIHPFLFHRKAIHDHAVSPSLNFFPFAIGHLLVVRNVKARSVYSFLRPFLPNMIAKNVSYRRE